MNMFRQYRTSILIVLGSAVLLFLVWIFFRDHTQYRYLQKPLELYATEEECKPHSRLGYCSESVCVSGKSPGPAKSDGSVIYMCPDTWNGWTPINQLNPT